MSAETDIRALLAGHPGVANLVADRIAQDAVPEGEPYPLIVYSVRHDLQRGLGSALLADPCSVTIQCWADSPLEAAALADAVVAAWATAPSARGAAVVERSTTFEEDLGKDGVLLGAEWWAPV